MTSIPLGRHALREEGFAQAEHDARGDVFILASFRGAVWSRLACCVGAGAYRLFYSIAPRRRSSRRSSAPMYWWALASG